MVSPSPAPSETRGCNVTRETQCKPAAAASSSDSATTSAAIVIPVAVVLSLLLLLLVLGVAAVLYRRRAGQRTQKVGVHTHSNAALDSLRVNTSGKAGAVKGDAFDMTLNPLYKKGGEGAAEYDAATAPIHYAIPLEETSANVYGQCVDAPALYDAHTGGGDCGAQTPQMYDFLQRNQNSVVVEAEA